MLTLKTPPMAQGDTRQQLAAQRDYLVYMQRELERALNNLDESNFAEGSGAKIAVSGSVGEKTRAAISHETQSLKQLILKSAEIVRHEMDELSTALRSSYVAQSEFGSFRQSVDAAISATADQIRQELDYDAEISRLSAETAAFEAYRVSTSGYIKSGIVDYEPDGVTPVFGIAIGQDIRSRTVTYDGEEYAEIDKNSFLSVFTAGSLSFYQNNVKVAYLSNEKLYITTAHISDRLELGDNWEISTQNGLSLKWTGA